MTMNSFHKILLAVLAIWLEGTAFAQSEDGYSRLENYRYALALVEKTLRIHGGMEDIRKSGIVIGLEGTFDLTTRLQGRQAYGDDQTPIVERIAIDVAGERTSYDVDWYNYVGSNQKLREIHDSEGRILFLDHRTRGGGYLHRESVQDAQNRFRRYLPNLLLFNALERRSTIQYLGQNTADDRIVERVSFTTLEDDVLTLEIDSETGLLSSVSSVIDMPLLGDTEIRWLWKDYKQQGTLIVPGSVQVFLGGKLMKNVASKVTMGVADQDFEIPSNYSVGPAPETLSPIADFIPYGQREPVVETITPGVHMVRDLRPGFLVMFVEFEDYMVAIDAPAGWYEMQQMPPMNWSIGDNNSSLGDKLLKAMKATAPGKPVKYLVLTHHHSDHIGGLRSFVAEGVELLAGLNAASMAQNAANSDFTLSPDRLTGSETEPAVTVVDGRFTLQDSGMIMQLIELPDGNPKADNYLMVYLPKQKILYTTGFIYPVPKSAFPVPESVPMSIYFVNWLDRSGLEVDRIYNLHGTGLVEEWQLQKIRELAAERIG